MSNYTMEQLTQKDILIESILEDKTYFLKLINSRKYAFGITDTAENVFAAFLAEVYLNITNKFNSQVIAFATESLKHFMQSYNNDTIISLNKLQEDSHFDIKAEEDNSILEYEVTYSYYIDLLFQLENTEEAAITNALDVLANLSEYTKEQIKFAKELLYPVRELAVKIINYLMEQNIRTNTLIFP